MFVKGEAYILAHQLRTILEGSSSFKKGFGSSSSCRVVSLVG